MIDLKILDLLCKERNTIADQLENSEAICNLREIVSSENADKGHFIFELLQNADDVNADFAEFKLYNSFLLFIHNGKRKFTVTNPNSKPLGDLNSISAVGNSTKNDKTNKIGKFGMGFKSVYRYSDTPFIKEDNFCVKFEKVIRIHRINEIPQKFIQHLNNNYLFDKTLFVIPFNSSTLSQDDSYNEIHIALEKLKIPTIFLNHLKKIKVCIDDEITIHTTETLLQGFEVIENNKINYKFLKSQKYINNRISDNILNSSKSNTQYFWKISEYINQSIPTTSNNNSLESSILIEATDKNHKYIKPINDSELYCYFSMGIPLNLKFIINAPFKTNIARNDIVDENYNHTLLTNIADLFGYSILILRKQKAYRDEILEIFPNTSSRQKITSDINYPPLQKVFLNIFKRNDVIPVGTENYEYIVNCLFCNDEKYKKIFASEYLYQLLNKHIFFAFNNITESNYSTSFICDTIGIPKFNINDLISKITPTFMSKTSESWRFGFYELLSEKCTSSKALSSIIKTVPIFKNKENNWLCYQNQNGEIQIFDKSEYSTNQNILHKEYYESVQLLKYIKIIIDLRKQNPLDILRKDFNEIDYNICKPASFFNKVFDYYLSIKNDNKSLNELSEFLKDKKFIKKLEYDKSKNTKQDIVYSPKQLYVANNKDELFRLIYEIQSRINLGCEHKEIVDIDFYITDNPKRNVKDLKNFFILSGVKNADTFIEHDFYDRSIKINIEGKSKIFSDIFTKIPGNENIYFGNFGSRYCELLDNEPIGISYMLLDLYELYKTQQFENNQFQKLSKSIFNSIVNILDKSESNILDQFYTSSSYGCFSGQTDIKRKSLIQYFMVLIDKNNIPHKIDEQLNVSELSDIYKFDNLSQDKQKAIFKFFNLTDDRTILKLSANLCSKVRSFGEEKFEKALNLYELIDLKKLTVDQEHDLLINIEKLINQYTVQDHANYLSSCKEETQETIIFHTNNHPHNSESISEVSISASNRAVLSKEERKDINENVVRPKAFEFLKAHGYEFLESEVNRSTIKATKNGIEYLINFKSYKNDKESIKFASFEIGCFRIYKDKYRLIILTNKNQIKGPFTLDDLFKSNEQISLTCNTKDYNDAKFDKFIDALQYLDGFSLNLSTIAQISSVEFNYLPNSQKKKICKNDDIDSDEEL